MNIQARTYVLVMILIIVLIIWGILEVDKAMNEYSVSQRVEIGIMRTEMSNRYCGVE